MMLSSTRAWVLLFAGALFIACDTGSPAPPSLDTLSLDPPTASSFGAIVASDVSRDTLQTDDFWTYKSEHVHAVSFPQDGETVTRTPNVTLFNLGAQVSSTQDRVFLQIPGFLPETRSYTPGLPGIDTKGRPAPTFSVVYHPTRCSSHVYRLDPWDDTSSTLTVTTATETRVTGRFDVILARERVGRGGDCAGRVTMPDLTAETIRVAGRFDVVPQETVGGR
mgnify:CR=1 FL=1